MVLVPGNLANASMTRTSFTPTEHYDYTYPHGLNLKPGSETHTKILTRLLQFLQQSHGAMSKRYKSWKEIDRVNTAYIQIDSDGDDEMTSAKSRKHSKKKPDVSIVFPYSCAILDTLTTYMFAALAQDPIFRYEGVTGEDTIGAILLESIIAQSCDRNKVALPLHVMIRDALSYGLGPVIPGWLVREGYRTVWDSMLQEKRRQKEVLHEGSTLDNIDPYHYFPDPNVAVHKIQDGEGFAYGYRTNYINLLSEEHQGVTGLFNVRYLSEMAKSTSGSTYYTDESARQERVGGSQTTPLMETTRIVDRFPFYLRIIPKEWELGSQEYPEMWLFELANDTVIINAKRADFDHDMYPTAVAAPDFDGYSPTPVSRLEMLYGLQYVADFLLNSHIRNVKNAIYNMLVVDPYLVNVADVEDPKPGKIIRTRRPAWGRGVKDVIQQLAVQDITRTNISDSVFVQQMMQQVGATDEGTMGIMRQGGPERLTNGEYQGTRFGAVSRLTRLTRLVSLQAMQDIGRQFANNTQQMMSRDAYVKVTGRLQETLMKEFGEPLGAIGVDPSQQGLKMKVSPFHILVNWDVMIRDGSIAGSNQSDIMLRMFESIVRQPELYQTFDIGRIFQSIARSGGEKNVEDFLRIKVKPDTAVLQGVQQGNLLPVSEAANALPQ